MDDSKKSAKNYSAPKLPGRPSFREALKFWVKLGFISFGGPAGQIAIMHEYVVGKKKWISNSRFFHALNYCMLLPGPEAQQLATYIGWLLHGRLGGLAAGILFVLPSMFILLALSIVYVEFGNVPWVYAMFKGLKPAVIAIVILALVKIGKRSLTGWLHIVLAGLAFICIFFLGVPFPLIIAGTIALALALRFFVPGWFGETKLHEATAKDNEADYYLNAHIKVAGAGFRLPRLVKQVLVALALWAVPMAIFFMAFPQFGFWSQLSLFFTQAAFVTFGGAYAVLPYVAQVSVEQLNWLTSLQMVDGLALGETTPGPLIMVLAFVGFMAGYNHFGASLSMGTLGLATATFYTFLPCFLFIFAGAPIIEKTRHIGWLKDILSLVTAAVVGVVLNLTVYLGREVLFPDGVALGDVDYLSIGWLLVSLVALYKFKVGLGSWIGITALVWLVLYFVIG